MGKMSSTYLIFTTMFLVSELMICCWAREATAASGCSSHERDALLKFKASLSDPSNRLLSWNASIDCCSWRGVNCDQITGHVIGLDLGNKRYGDLYNSSVNMLHSDTLDSSILDLGHLSFLDLSANNFQSISIPEFLGSMSQLQHLNLSYAKFSGVVPHHLGNLSRLSVLDISTDDYLNKLVADDFTWVSRLSSLVHLDMSGVDLSGSKDMLNLLSMLQHVILLRLSSCSLENGNLQHDFTDSTGIEHLNFTNNSSLLESLSLSNNLLNGDISKIVSDLSGCCNNKLESLDLDGNGFYGQLPAELGGFKKLQILHLHNNLISGPVPPSLWNLSSLKELDLSHNHLNNSIQSFTGNLPFLEYLDLSSNHLEGSIPPFIGNFSSMEYLDLSFNQLKGSIPSTIGNLKSLEFLVLFENQLSSLIPSSLGNLSVLKTLHLAHNKLNGEVPVSLGQLSNLQKLYLSDNYLNGTISEAHFATLSKLTHLELHNNSIKVDVRSDWTPLFQLHELHMRSCEIVGGQFPGWVRTQNELEFVDLSNCSISGVVPNWLHYKSTITYLHLSHNHLEGSLPDSLCEMKSLWYLGLLDNRLSGNLPDCWANLTMLQHLMLSVNSFSGVIPKSIGGAYSLIRLQLSNNSFTGEVPSALGNCTKLRLVDLSLNNLSGQLPDIWGSLKELSVVILSSNQFSGAIPDSIGGASSLEWLQLNGNKFTGELPPGMGNCTALNALDVSDNSISGELPEWIGNKLVNLQVLTMRSNKFDGTIPSELCQLPVYLLDFANNMLTGEIPHCFGNFSEMISDSADKVFKARNNLLVVIKGTALEYFGTLQYVLNMDLSNNNLVGEIPVELTRLTALHFLNLSHNHLHGEIPGRIGELKLLESLDLSNNYLVGNIPQSLSDLTSLSHLNLSRNNLTGEIPTGSQLQTLEDPSIYGGNPGLCGAPLPKKCLEVGAANVAGGEDDNKDDKIVSYGIIASGFATGFWGVIGVLVFKRSWRCVYYKFSDGIIGRFLGT